MTATPGLTFEQAPPFSVPLRFFLTAPWFLVLAAWLMLWQGPALFTSRWSPVTLALTHLFTLGFMAQVMLGALLQILPVVVGVVVPRPRLTAILIHLPLTLGTLALVAGLGWMWPTSFRWATGLLGLAFSVALVAIHIALWRAPVANGTVITLRHALIGLLAAVGLGLGLSGFFGWGWRLPVTTLTDLHAGWGLLGWTLLLVAGVAYQVVPMFQITPPYPPRFVSIFAWLMMALLIVWSGFLLVGWSLAARWAGVGLAAGSATFAGITLVLLAKRRRKIGDATLNYWRASLCSLLAAAGLWLVTRPISGWAQAPQVDLLLGILMIAGFALGVINGMLYKIVAFLAWFHLQAQFRRRAKLPNMKQLLPDTAIRRQWWAYGATLCLLLAAALDPALFSRPAGLVLGITGAWLGINLSKVAIIYRRIGREAKPAADPAGDK